MAAELTERNKAGVSQRQLARNLGVNRETVGKYIKSWKADTMGVDGLLVLDEPEFERRLNGGVAAYSDKRHDELASPLPGIEDKMRRGHKCGATIKLLWEEYWREEVTPLDKKINNNVAVNKICSIFAAGKT